MSIGSQHTALETWVNTTYGASFTVNSTSIKVLYGNLEVTKQDIPCVRFMPVWSLTSEETDAMTQGRGALICQVFTKAHIGETLAYAVMAQIESDAKRSTYQTAGYFGSPEPQQGSGGIEPSGFYQINLRIPWQYYEAA